MSARDEGGAYARIRENLSELGLDAMAAGLPHWMSAVAAGEADFASAMLAMTSEEAEAKRRRGTDRKVRAAGFPFVKTLADFDFSFQPSIPRAVVDDLAALRFLDAAENVVLVGSPGVGKTHIAVALGVEAVRARKEVRFTDCAALVRDLKDASSRGILAKRLKYYAHATLLIIDELGYLDVDEEGVLPPMYFPPFTPMIHNRSRQPAPAGYANVFPPLSAPPSNLSRNARASRARALSEPG